MQIYRRHSTRCSAKRPENDRAFWKCQCPISVEGRIGQEVIRESLRTRDRKEALKRVQDAEVRGYWNADGQSTDKTVEVACALFLADLAGAKGRQLRSPTLAKYRLLFRRLEQFCKARRIRYLKEITTDHLRAFRDTWPTGVRSTANHVARLRAFFRFSLENEWLPKNPAIAIRPPRAGRGEETQKDPFTAEEMERILAAALDEKDLYALILLMRWTGLRISDAAFLRPEHLDAGSVKIKTRKTGSVVTMPVKVELRNVLSELAPQTNGYWFVKGSDNLNTVTDYWRERLHECFKRAEIVGGTPHRFRHTFACEMLLKGVDIKTLSLLLGHHSVLVTERYYAKFVKEREKQLAEIVKKSWEKDAA